MKISAYISNLLLRKIYENKFKNFIRSSKNIEVTQSEYLFRILKNNQYTSYGKRYGFKTVKSVKDYQNQIPISEYDDYLQYIDQIRKGKRGVLFKEPVKHFALTSNTINTSKWIPYNESLKKEFSETLSVWAHNLFSSFPSLLHGTGYWFITPIENDEKYDSKVPVGFEEDIKYFGNINRNLVSSILSVPTIVSRIQDFDHFKYITLLFLLSDSELRLISVRSPTYLKILLDYCSKKLNALIEDIKLGTISVPIDSKIKNELLLKFKKNPGRATYLSNVFLKENFTWEDVWKKLKVISLWKDSKAKLFLKEIEKYFPNTKIQGKGLISTEGIVTFPFSEGEFSGNLLGINSHFFEFREIETQKIFLAHELKMDTVYEVILTTGGGLYRYSTKDRVELIGYFNQIPSLHFLGKEETISDLVGEKLSELYLSQILVSEFKKFKITPGFYYVKPTSLVNSAYYILYLESLSIYNKQELALSIDTALRENIYYAHARKTGQLLEFQVKKLPNDSMKEYFVPNSGKVPVGKTKHSLFQNQNEGGNK